ncbi:MAG: hypothetical protein JO243_00540 [Solirubrobacterales bacterium]|nr:hypothetical protein [Solirubrobacterales bacterium]
MVVLCGVIDLERRIIPNRIAERRIIPNRITGPEALLALALGVALDRGGEPKRLSWAASRRRIPDDRVARPSGRDGDWRR